MSLLNLFKLFDQCDCMVCPPHPIICIIFLHSRQVSRDDPLVDISNLYTAMFNKDDIVEGYFMTCKSHKEQIEYQTIAYGALSHENAFWV